MAYKKFEASISSKFPQLKEDQDKFKKDSTNFPEWKKFEIVLNQIESRDLIRGMSIFYSPDLVRELAVISQRYGI